LQCVAVCCSVLQCVAVCCSVLQCVAVCCNVLQCVAVCHTHLELLQCVAVCVCTRQLRVCHTHWSNLKRVSLSLNWELLQCVAACCSVLQCVSVHFDWECVTHTHTHTHTLIRFTSLFPPQMRYTSIESVSHTHTHHNILQHTATYCNILQHTATHCNTLQHTATHCHTLQHTATHYNTLQHTATAPQGARVPVHKYKSLNTYASSYFLDFVIYMDWTCEKIVRTHILQYIDARTSRTPCQSKEGNKKTLLLRVYVLMYIYKVNVRKQHMKYRVQYMFEENPVNLARPRQRKKKNSASTCACTGKCV